MSLDSVAHFVSCPKILQANRGVRATLAEVLMITDQGFKMYPSYNVLLYHFLLDQNLDPELPKG